MKKLYSISLAAALVSFSTNAYADTCSEVLKLSALSSGSIQTSSSVEEKAANYCRDYQKTKGSGGSQGGNVGYAGFEVGYSSSSTSNKSVAEKICKSDSSGDARDDAYETYINTVAPGGFEAYQSCLGGQKDLTISIGASTPTHSPITISFRPSNTDQKARVEFVLSSNVTCIKKSTNGNVEGDDLQSGIVINKAGSFGVQCNRDDQGEMGSITILDAESSNANSQLSVPWTAYDKDGVPLALATRYQQSISDAQALQNSLKGSVIAFNSDTCKAPFVRYSEANGRFLRGIDPTNVVDIDRAALPMPDRVGSQQEDAFKSHSHQFAGTGHAHKDHSSYNTEKQRVSKGTGFATTAVGNVNETRPKNVAVSYCVLPN